MMTENVEALDVVGGNILIHLTDVGNAALLVRLHGEDLRYCDSWKNWLVWAGTRWERDGTRAIWWKAPYFPLSPRNR